MGNKVPDLDKGAVQKADYHGSRLDKGAVEAHEPVGDEPYITSIMASAHTFNTACDVARNYPLPWNVPVSP